jgi:hypothetical protein
VKALGVNVTLMKLNLRSNPLPAASLAALKAVVTFNPYALDRITPAQRLAFLMGHLRRPNQQSSLMRLPFDMVRRILTRYKVAQGRRTWDGGKMSICPSGN